MRIHRRKRHIILQHAPPVCHIRHRRSRHQPKRTQHDLHRHARKRRVITIPTAVRRRHRHCNRLSRTAVLHLTEQRRAVISCLTRTKTQNSVRIHLEPIHIRHRLHRKKDNSLPVFCLELNLRRERRRPDRSPSSAPHSTAPRTKTTTTTPMSTQSNCLAPHPTTANNPKSATPNTPNHRQNPRSSPITFASHA